MDGGDRVNRYRTIWISDVHLGAKACKADYLLDFLKHNESETLYLVGDIADGWRLKRHWHWPQSHNDVVQKLLRKGRKGTRVIYLPGNHDEFARQFIGESFGRIEIYDDFVHVAADGRQYLVMHGDRFDVVVKHAKWLAHIGDKAYVILLAANTILNSLRRRLGLRYWSLSAYLKHKTKKAVEYVGRYENVVGDEARRRGVDGVVCGHIHTAELKDMSGVVYANDGDWVESCTALVEHQSGQLELIYWLDVMEARDAAAAEPRRAVA